MQQENIRDAVHEAVYAALDEVNALRPPGQRLEKSPDTVLLGPSGQLDSLGLVNFIVATEMNIEAELGVSINLADEKAMGQENSPFRTVGSFTNYIARLLED